MTLAPLVIVLSSLGAGLTGAFAAVYAVNPAKGLALTSHRADALPSVMGGRYLGFALLAAAAAWHGAPGVIAALFAVFALIGLVDAAIYARAGQPAKAHLAAGIGCAVVALLGALAAAAGAA